MLTNASFNRQEGRGRRVAPLALGLALLSALAGVASCRRSGDAPADPVQAAPSALDPAVPAPDALVADLVLGSPNASWAKLQRGIGGAVGLLPATAGGILCAAAGLDPVVANELDGVAPIYGVVAGDGVNAGVLLAVKLLDPRKARAALLDGAAPRFTARDAGAVTELTPRGDQRAALSVGLSVDGYLLLARRPEDLTRLGPYVTRTLPRRPLPADGALVAEVPRAALGAVVRPKLEEAWASAKRFLLAEDERSRRAHGGRPPDFADPTAIVAAADGWVTRHLAVLGDLAALRLALAVTDDGLVLTSTLTPQPGDGAAARFTSAMATGDVAELAKLPAVSAVAWLTRDSDAARAAQAVEAERALGAALGGRLSELDAKRLRDVLEDVAKARGDLVASSLVWDEPQGLALRAEVRDAAAADRALRGIAELAKSGPFKELLRVRSVTTTSSEVSGLGKASTVTVAREPSRSLRRGPRADDGAGAMRVPGDGGADDAGASGSPARRDDLGFAWRVEGGVLELAASEAPLATLAAAARPDRKLADEPAVARALAALGSTSSAVLLVQPLRFDRARAGLPAAPVVVALGRKEGAAVLRVDVANGVLRELARRQMGL